MAIVRVACLLLLAFPAHADTANVGKSTSVLDFNVPQSASAGPDIDGDGQISRAEAAGNAELTLGFDRADRNRNGRISTAEWQRYEKWQERQTKAREAREARLARAKAKESASAGATRAKRP
jgi:hypothetical protein